MKIKKITLLHVYLLLTSYLLNAQYNFEMIKDINPNGDSNPDKFTYFNNKLIFTADDGVHGREPWISDGTNAGTFMLKDFVLNGSSNITDFQVYNGKVYFSATDGINFGTWVTDGTIAGTDFFSNVAISSSINYNTTIIFNNLLYFTGIDGTSGIELWVTDGTTSGTQLVKDIEPNGDSIPGGFFELNGNLYFFARNPQNGKRSLWITDGTNTGTIIVNTAVDWNFSEVVVYNNKGYFPSFTDANNGSELWSTDGTTNGTQLLKDINPGVIGSFISDFKVFNNRLFFSADDGSVGSELWVTDGTTNGTVLFHNFLSPGDGDPRELTVLGNIMYMRANGSTVGLELFATTGTNNAYLVKDIVPFAGNSRPFYLNVYNNELFFIASDDPSGSGTIFDLWVSDGTQQGTIKIAPPIAPNVGPLNTNNNNFVVLNNSLFFVADFNSNGNELWKLTATALSLSEFDLANQLKVYPNPTNAVINVKFPTDFKGSYTLFDNLGKQILSSTSSSLETQISLDNYASGLYLLVITNDNGRQIQSHKILKQ